MIRTRQHGRHDRWGRARVAPRDLVTYALLALGGAALAVAHSWVLAGAFATAFVVARILVPPVSRIAVRMGAVVLPGGRNVHRRATPLCGGVAILVPFVVATLLLGILGDAKAFGIAAGATLLMACGAADDRKHVRARTKILCQALAGLCLVLAGFRLDELSVPGLPSVALGPLAVPALLFWVVLASNAFNLTDGMDGLAASLCLVACAGSVAVGSQVLPAVCLAGATIGFLRHNLPPAAVFLGDAGSLPIGFVIAAFALDAPAAGNVPIAYGLLAYSLGDVGLAVLRRFIRAKPLFQGDRSHLHHKLRDHLRTTSRAPHAPVPLAGAPPRGGRTFPGVVSLAVSLALWVGLVAMLMRVGHVRIRIVWSNRADFRRLHIVRRYVSDSLQVARDAQDVETTLRHLAEDLHLHSLVVGDIVIENGHGGHYGPHGHDDAYGRGATALEAEVPVALSGREARWSYAPHGAEWALDQELRSVVTEMIRDADARLEALAHHVPLVLSAVPEGMLS